MSQSHPTAITHFAPVGCGHERTLASATRFFHIPAQLFAQALAAGGEDPAEFPYRALHVVFVPGEIARAPVQACAGVILVRSAQCIAVWAARVLCWTHGIIATCRLMIGKSISMLTVTSQRSGDTRMRHRPQQVPCGTYSGSPGSVSGQLILRLMSQVYKGRYSFV